MLQKIISPSLILSLSLILLMLCFSMAGTQVELLLEFNRDKILQGEYWRLITSNLVHYGFAHVAMNAAAFIIISFTLLRELSLKTYAMLLLICALAVNMGTLVFNPELSFYRGFSGALHGLIVAGLLFNSVRNRWLSYLGVILVFGKIIHEHQTDFQANELQALLPVKVAVDSHLYGALAGLVFFALMFAYSYFRKSIKSD